MRKKARWRWFYGLSLFLNVGIVIAQCNGTAKQILAMEPGHGHIQSPGYPNGYPADLRCLYDLKAQSSVGLVIQIDVLELELREPFFGTKQCLRDYLIFVVIDRNGREHLTDRFCGQTQTLPVIHTLQSQIRIVFNSGVASPETRRGFRLRYAFVPEVDIRAPPSAYFDSNNRFRKECGGSSGTNEISGEIQSPGYPFTYPRNVTCNWLIRVAEGKRVYLRLIHLQLSTTVAECDRSSLHFIDGFKHELPPGEQPPHLSNDIRYCGSQSYYNEEGMKSYLSNGNRVIIRFITTDYPSAEQLNLHQTDGTAIGFKILWTEVNSLVASEETQGDDTPCRGFTCLGGTFCLDDGHNICASRTRLCINETLKCNRISNCAENDNSDEEFCYSDDMLSYVILGTVAALVLMAVFCVCFRLLSCFGPKQTTQQQLEDRVYDNRGVLRPLPFNPGPQSVFRNQNGRTTRTNSESTTADNDTAFAIWRVASPSQTNRRDSSVRFQRLHRAQV
ncbi:Neuropilin and tolloid-like protein 1 [Aphelenchoides besseyi]|nr:Neuropilin and tolloid-like protein 1 [Aphelenchoides besseyi]